MGIDETDPLDFGMVPCDGNTNTAGVGVRGGVGSAMRGSKGHVTVPVEVPDIGEALARVDELGGTRRWNQVQTSDDTALGRCADPETTPLVSSALWG